MEDTEFIEEGTIRRKLRLVNGRLEEIERGTPMFSGNGVMDGGLVRGTKTGKLYNKWELIKEAV